MIRGTACLVAICLPLSAQDPQEPRVTFGITVVIPSALQGRIYNIRHNTKKLPNFRKMKPVGTIYTTSLNIPPQDFRQGFPGVTTRFEWYAIDYNGRFWAEKPGEYGFGFSADGKFVVMDVANNDVLTASSQTEQALQHAVPLKLVEDGEGYKLYAGKKWVGIKTK